MLGMYDRNDWGGPVDPFILAEFPNITVEGDKDPIVSLIIFEWRDEWLIGAGSNSKELICDPENVAKNLCKEEDIGKWILAQNATEKAQSLILTQAVHLKNSSPINYPIKKTGYYCVAAYGYSEDDFMGVVEFREAYGELPATQIPKLPFYGGITILYAIVVV